MNLTLNDVAFVFTSFVGLGRVKLKCREQNYIFVINFALFNNLFQGGFPVFIGQFQPN